MATSKMGGGGVGVSGLSTCLYLIPVMIHGFLFRRIHPVCASTKSAAWKSAPAVAAACMRLRPAVRGGSRRAGGEGPDGRVRGVNERGNGQGRDAWWRWPAEQRAAVGRGLLDAARTGKAKRGLSASAAGRPTASSRTWRRLWRRPWRPFRRRPWQPFRRRPWQPFRRRPW